MSTIKNKIVVSFSLILLLMLIHVTTIFNDCKTQINENISAISAFEG